MFSFLKSSGPRVQSLAPADAVALAAKGELTLIDVRELAEVKSTGKAKGALHIPLSLVPVKCDPRSPDCPKALAPEKPIAVYCLSGGRSGMAAGTLLQMGYQTVYNLGGFGGWTAAGGQVEKA